MSGIEAAFFGALGRDAEAKTSKAGKAYLRLNVRVGDGDGAQWVSVMAFDQNAIDAADKMVKGARVYVEGSLSVTEWSAQDGVKRHGLSVMSWHCRLSQIGRNKPPRAARDQDEARA
jgi:single-stranded DNA-binding protein